MSHSRTNASLLSDFPFLIDWLCVVGISSPPVPLVVAHFDLDVSWIASFGTTLGEDQDVKGRAELGKVFGDAACRSSERSGDPEVADPEQR